MGRADGTSRNNKRLDGIVRTFKVFTDGFDDELLADFDKVVIFVE